MPGAFLQISPSFRSLTLRIKHINIRMILSYLWGFYGKECYLYKMGNKIWS